jgi:uncharacterized protein (TIGR00730 family)
MKRVCVFAGSSSGTKRDYRDAAADLGQALVSRRIDLVYGGGNVGLMGVLADTMLASDGHVIGVIPGALMAREVGHVGLPDLRVVGSMHERKALMADLADGFIALPGGWGTLDELFEILTWGQLGLHGKPVGLLNAGGYFDPLLAFLAHTVDEGFVRRENHAMIAVSASAPDLLAKMAAYVPPTVEKWIDANAGEPR